MMRLQQYTNANHILIPPTRNYVITGWDCWKLRRKPSLSTPFPQGIWTTVTLRSLRCGVAIYILDFHNKRVFNQPIFDKAYTGFKTAQLRFRSSAYRKVETRCVLHALIRLGDMHRHAHVADQ